MDKYGLIGFPLGHSFSISYFNEKFHNEGIDAEYENYEIALNNIIPNLKDDEILLITGSLYLISAVRGEILEKY